MSGKHTLLASTIALTMLGGIAGCGASSTPPAAKPAGQVSVAYAGSLQWVDDQEIGPAFTQATGNRYEGRGGGSFGIAQEIRSGTIPANVFESLGYAPIRLLEPRLTTWAVSFAASPLVVAYNPKSPFAPQLNAIRDGRRPLKELFLLMANPTFHLGRTNPNTDPQGQAFYWMMELAAKHYGLGAHWAQTVLGPLDNPRQVYSEEGILTVLQAGGLDASSAFLSEAKERHLDYIVLPNWLNFADPSDNSWYHQATITLNNGKTVQGQALTVDITTVGRPTAAAQSFVRFVLGSHGRSLMQRAGFDTFTPSVLGNPKAVPSGIRAMVR